MLFHAMDNYIVAVFDTEAVATEALHQLFLLGTADNQITVHGAAVAHYNASGHLAVATKETDPGVRTAAGVAIGALIFGVIGAAIGGVAGLLADGAKSREHEEALREASSKVLPGQAAVVAEVGEHSTVPIDTLVGRLGGRVYRRKKGEILEHALTTGQAYRYLHPNDYDPYFDHE
jgi:uncharacterized membrane protein